MLIAYWLGYQVGAAAAGAKVQAPPGDIALATPPGSNAPELEINPANVPSELDVLLAEHNWYQLAHWLQQRGHVSVGEGRTIRDSFAANMNKYDAVAMRQVMQTYLSLQPLDAEAALMLADLYLVEGLNEGALEVLFEVLAGGFTESIHRRALQNTYQIVNTIAAQLKNRGAIGELESFYQHVSQKYPVSDRFRLEWAKALAGLNRFDEAKRTLAEVGTSDVNIETVEAFAKELQSRERGPQFLRRGNQYVAQASASNGFKFELLVDTGASITSLSRNALRQTNATDLGRTVEVRTAAGMVTTGMFQIPYVEIQGEVFRDLLVLQVPAELPGLNGLLGMDVMQRMQWSVDKL